MQDNDSIEMLLLELKNKNSGENKQELIKELEARHTEFGLNAFRIFCSR